MDMLVSSANAYVRDNPAVASRGILRLLNAECFSCGNERPGQNIKGALAVTYYVCDECRTKFNEDDLRNEADRLMAFLKQERVRRALGRRLDPDDPRLMCKACGRVKVEQNPFTLLVPLMCDGCFRQYKQSLARAPKKARR